MKKRTKNSKSNQKKDTLLGQSSLELHAEIDKLQQKIEDLTAFAKEARDRIEDLEIHVNLLTRLITTLCIEKMGMRVGVLKKLIKRIESEAVRDSQIMHLESLYNLPSSSESKIKPPKQAPAKGDPWDEIS